MTSGRGTPRIAAAGTRLARFAQMSTALPGRMATYRRALLTSAYTGARSAARAGRPVRDDRLLGAVPTGRLAARDLDPRRRRSVLVGHRRRRVHGGLRLRQLTRRRARRPPWRAAFAARFRGGQRRYRPIRLGLDRDLLRRLPRARRARAVFAGRVRLSLRCCSSCRRR